MDRKKIKIIRKKLDFVDSQLLNLLVKRTNYVKKILKLKKFKKDIIDRKRIKQVLINIKKKSIKKKIDSTITNNIWKAMIRSYINYERRNFNKKL